ncbi:MAG: hypothetical protein HS130_04720 [Deltaproteobacteria bacterium]|nr:hypothetical protein [Deltaproteobacteria bacterium]
MLKVSSIILFMSAGSLSLTGLYIIPAWQNLHPLVQPRAISTLTLSWTVSMKGTTGLVGSGRAFMSGTVLFTTLSYPSRSGTILFTVPSPLYSGSKNDGT